MNLNLTLNLNQSNQKFITMRINKKDPNSILIKSTTKKITFKKST